MIEMTKTKKTDANNTQKKKHDWNDVIAWVKERDRHFRGKRRHIDHDLIAHGVSRDGTTLGEHEKKKKQKMKKERIG